MRKILIVEDEPVLRESYELMLSTEPYEVHSAVNGAEALMICKKHHFDLIILDIMMPIMDGVQFLEHYTKETDRPSKVVVMSNLSAGDDLTKALSLGAHKNFLKSDLSPREFLSMVRYELKQLETIR